MLPFHCLCTLNDHRSGIIKWFPTVSFSICTRAIQLSWYIKSLWKPITELKRSKTNQILLFTCIMNPVQLYAGCFCGRYRAARSWRGKHISKTITHLKTHTQILKEFWNNKLEGPKHSWSILFELHFRDNDLKKKTLTEVDTRRQSWCRRQFILILIVLGELLQVHGTTLDNGVILYCTGTMSSWLEQLIII